MSVAATSRASTARRDLTLLAVGQAVSVAGDMAAFVALLLRLRPEGSGWVAALLAAQLLPVVALAPLAGRVVDHVESRQVLLAALAGQAVVAVPLALLSSPWATVALFAVLSGFAVFAGPARSSLVPVITGEDEARRGYSRVATGTSTGYIIGPIVGGVLTATLGVTVALLIDAGSFVVLTVAVWLMRVRRPPADAPDAHAERRGGFAIIRRSKVLSLALVISAVAISCAVVDNVAAPYRFVNQLGGSSTVYGAYLTLWGAGAFVGTQVLPRLPKGRTETALAAGNLLIGAGTAGIGLAATVPVAFVASVVGGFGNGLANVSESALIAAHTPASHRGRVFASAGAIMQVAIGAGTVAAAPLVAVLGANHAMILGGALATVVAAFGVAVSLRRTDPPEPASVR